jgi:hypothetical protein
MLALTVGSKEEEAVPEGAMFHPSLGLTMADGGEKINPDEIKIADKQWDLER